MILFSYFFCSFVVAISIKRRALRFICSTKLTTKIYLSSQFLWSLFVYVFLFLCWFLGWFVFFPYFIFFTLLFFIAPSLAHIFLLLVVFFFLFFSHEIWFTWWTFAFVWERAGLSTSAAILARRWRTWDVVRFTVFPSISSIANTPVEMGEKKKFVFNWN